MNTNKRILITGGSGFVGSGLAINLKKKYPNYEIVCLDNLRRRGSELNLSRFHEHNIQFVHGDIRSKSDLEEIGEVSTVIDAAAEPSVLAGIHSGTNYLIETNLNGTINTLEYAKKWKSDFIFLSTSRVYPISHLEGLKYKKGQTRFELESIQELKGVSQKGISEDFPLDQVRSLYGSTKLASEMFVNEYGAQFNIKTVINRCGVLTGPYQMGKVDQGVVVLWLAKHLWKKELSYIGYEGSGKQVRDILHIDDLFKLVDWQIHNMSIVDGDTFNVGGGTECSVSLQELTYLCQEVTGNNINIQKVPKNRPGDIPLYITDNTKISNLTGWKPGQSPKSIISDTFEWLKSNERGLKKILS